MNNNIQKKSFFSSFAFLSLGMISGYISHAGDSSWYQSLIKPSFNPPSWIFSPVWTILYIMLGIIFIHLWEKRNKDAASLYLFIFQYALNLAWSPLFFKLHRIDLALANLFIMWIITLLVYIRTSNSRQIQMLLLPYIVWLSFALLLNYKIYQLNIIQ